MAKFELDAQKVAKVTCNLRNQCCNFVNPSVHVCRKMARPVFFSENIDFLDDKYEDIWLSQACQDIENELVTFDGMSQLSLTQCVSKYDVDMENVELGTFNVEIPEMVETVTESTHYDLKRFSEPVSTDEMKTLIGQQENGNTKKNTTWAIGVFESWRLNRNEAGEKIPELIGMSSEEMNFILSRFVMETRKKDGTPYPPRSLYLIACGILRHLRNCDVNDKNFLDTRNGDFSGFRKVLDARMKELLSNGLGTDVKQAQPLMPEDEDKLWESGVFGTGSAESLQCTVFFYACKLFGLRGHDEHHSLVCDQFVVDIDQNGKYVEFIGRGSKTYKGGLKDRELTNKKIRHYSAEGERCIADCFEQYINALGGGVFYRRPLIGTPIRYGNQAVGVNKLKNMMKVICNRGGLKGNYTNHSGKRTCATQLYMAGVDEQEIMRRTGHRSEKGVRKYKTAGAAIMEKVGAVLDPPQAKCSKRKIDELGIDSDTQNPSETTAEAVKRTKQSPLQDLSNRPFFNNCQISFNVTN